MLEIVDSVEYRRLATEYCNHHYSSFDLRVNGGEPMTASVLITTNEIFDITVSVNRKVYVFVYGQSKLNVDVDNGMFTIRDQVTDDCIVFSFATKVENHI